MHAATEIGLSKRREEPGIGKRRGRAEGKLRGIVIWDVSLINVMQTLRAGAAPDEPGLPSQPPSSVLRNGAVHPARKAFW